jgi:hypothetical protein
VAASRRIPAFFSRECGSAVADEEQTEDYRSKPTHHGFSPFN